MGVFLRLFGGLRLERDGQAVAGRAIQKKRLALLALLGSSSGRPLSRDKLTAFLWPESDTERSRHQLASSVYDLRKALGEGVIVSAGDDLMLDRSLVGSDVAQFDEALSAGERERAVGLYAGPFLDGFFLSEAPELERWVEGERNRLAQVHAKALEELARDRAKQGDALGSVEWWRRLAAHDPYNGRVALCLIEALDAAGDRAGALQYAQAHADGLRNELGVEVDPEVAALAGRLRADALDSRPSGLSRVFSPKTVLPVTRSFAAAGAAPPQSLRVRRGYLPLVGLGLILAFTLITTTSDWHDVLGVSERGQEIVAPALPVVLMMDSPHPSRVYDEEVIAASGTNADVINDLLRDLPVQRIKEAAGPYWHRHEEIRQLRPDLVLIHFSAFCREVCEDDRIMMRAFLEYMADTEARFLIYSRMPPEVLARNMKDMLGDLPKRRPQLVSRIYTFPVRNYGAPRWKDPATAAAFKLRVKELLALR